MTTGQVDALGRALIMVTLRNLSTGKATTLEAWIDSGFLGELLVPRAMIAPLALDPNSSNDTIVDLADGSRVVVKSYVCALDWFGQELPVEVVVTDAEMPLLGVGVLRDHELRIHYPNRTVSIS